MKAVFLVSKPSSLTADAKELSQHFEVREVPMPVPDAGEVLVKMFYSPINVSDTASIKGQYNAKQQEALPCQLGFEGSGVVVKSGGGFAAWLVAGKRVAVASKSGGRMWAEYAVVNALTCVPLPDTVSSLQGSSVFVNPMSAMAFLELAQAAEARCAIFTAAASALGKMALRLFKSNGIKTIAIVRHSSNADAIRAEVSADQICIVTEEGKDWRAEVREKAGELGATIMFDAVGGKQTGEILQAMPPKSTAHVYGFLSGEPVGALDSNSLIFQQKKVQGFWLTPHLLSKNLLAQKSFVDRTVGLIPTDLRSPYRTVYPLDQVAGALHDYLSNMSGGKICISPIVQRPTPAADILKAVAQPPALTTTEAIVMEDPQAAAVLVQPPEAAAAAAPVPGADADATLLSPTDAASAAPDAANLDLPKSSNE